MLAKDMFPYSLKSDFHCDDRARIETATLTNIPREDDKRQ